jgi:hypothetical protein
MPWQRSLKMTIEAQCFRWRIDGGTIGSSEAGLASGTVLLFLFNDSELTSTVGRL